jgi:hypothetical protein
MKMACGGLEPDSCGQDQVSNQSIDSTGDAFEHSLNKGMIDMQPHQEVRAYSQRLEIGRRGHTDLTVFKTPRATDT